MLASARSRPRGVRPQDLRKRRRQLPGSRRSRSVAERDAGNGHGAADMVAVGERLDRKPSFGLIGNENRNAYDPYGRCMYAGAKVDF